MKPFLIGGLLLAGAACAAWVLKRPPSWLARNAWQTPQNATNAPAAETPDLTEVRDALSRQVERVQGQATRLDKAAQRVEDPVHQIQTHASKLGESLGRLNSLFDKVRAEHLTLTQEAKQSLEQLRSLTQANDAHQKVLNALGESAATLRERQEQINQNSGLIQDHTSKIATTTKRIENNHRVITELNEQLAGAPALLKQTLGTIQEQTAQLKEHEDLLATRRLAVDGKEEELEKLQRDLTAGVRQLLDQASIYQATAEELKSEARGESSQIQRIEENYSKLGEDLRKVNVELGDEQDKNRRLQKRYDRLESRLENANDRIAELEGQLGQRDAKPELPFTMGTLPDTFEKLVFRAQLRFHGVQIPDSALQGTDALNSAFSKELWIADTWKALNALHQYATTEHQFTGNFLRWCRDSGDPHVWFPNRVAMQESQTTMSRYGDKRVFEIDQAIATSGQIEMQAHIQIQEGGGQHIPRLFFYDDTDGPTKKVHIGFLGPHNLVPNAKSN